MVPIPNQPDPQNTNDTSAEHAEQDADDEAAEDTDDTRSEKEKVIWCWFNVLILLSLSADSSQVKMWKYVDSCLGGQNIK